MAAGLMTLGFVCAVASPQEAESPAASLAKAKAQYAQATEALRAELLDTLVVNRRKIPDGPEQAAKVQVLETERADLDSKSVWPASLRASPFVAQRAADRDALVKAFYAAMGACNRSDDLAEHQALTQELAAFEGSNDLAAWTSLAASVDLSSGESAWSRSGDALTSAVAAKATPQPLRVAQAAQPAASYRIEFTLAELAGGGCSILALDAAGAPFQCHVAPEDYSRASANRTFGDAGVHVTIGVVGSFVWVELEGKPILRDVRSSDAKDEPKAADSAWFALTPDADARIKITGLQSKPLVPVVAAVRATATKEPPAAKPEKRPPTASARVDSPRKDTWYEKLIAEPSSAVVTDARLLEALKRTGKPWCVRDRASNIEMLLVPANDDLTAFIYAGKYEVQVSEWNHVMSGARSAKEHGPPITNLGWNTVQEFLAKAKGLRLATAEEWETFCRAGTKGDLYGKLDKIAWYIGNAGGDCHEVGTKDPNALGLYDTIGNAFEWTADQRIRGGSWHHSVPNTACTASNATKPASPDNPGPGVGFRVVHDVE